MTDHKPRGDGPVQTAKDVAWTIFLVVGPFLGFLVVAVVVVIVFFLTGVFLPI